jgi:hypothetical protein
MIKWLGENGGELKSIFVCNKEDLCVQIRFLCRLHRGWTVPCLRILCSPTWNDLCLLSVIRSKMKSMILRLIYSLFNCNISLLIPKERSPFSGPILKFGQAIVDAIFVQKFSDFQWTYGLVLASRLTKSYKILIFALGVMPQKQNPFWI